MKNCNSTQTKTTTNFSARIPAHFLLTTLLALLCMFTKAQDKLVGLTSNGGTEGAGTAFSINTNGSNFSVIQGFVDWGAYPTSDLVRGTDGNLYGMIPEGGTYGNGTIYKITATGTITILKHLEMAVDGGYPRGSLIQATDGNFYGMNSSGSINNGGCIFKISPTGTYTIIRSLSINTDGGRPKGHLIQASDGNLYGMNNAGGAFGYGTIFKITPAGVYTVLKSFNTADGVSPNGSLLQAKDGNFYGMTYSGGTYNRGTLFRITPAGVYTVLHHFINNGVDGEYPKADLIQAKDGYLYGMTPSGGANYNGTIFKTNLSGSSYVVVRALSAGVEGGNPQGTLLQAKDGNFYGTAYSLSGGYGGSVFKMTTAGVTSVTKKFTLSTEGGYLMGSLMQSSDGLLYGTTNSGGKDGEGTIFKLTTAGAITVLKHLNGSVKGNMPQDNLTLGKDSAYYGVTTYGGTDNYGSVFKICGGVTTILHSFSNATDGGNPKGGLTRGADGNLYGCTDAGGSNGGGTIYKITPAGNFTVLRHLKSSTDGANPHGNLVQGADNAFYGVTSAGGTGSAGTIFRITTAGAFTVLHNFVSSSDGSASESGLTLGKDGLFYGITGSNAHFYKITTAGAFTLIRTFAYAEGTNPYGSLLLANDGNFYGTFSGGGANGAGVIFKITSAGSYTKLRDLNANNDGSYPKGGLVQASDGNLYGTTSAGGTNKVGTIFKITTGGSYTVLRHMNMATDGGASMGGLILAPTNNLVAFGQSVTTSEDIAKAITLTGSTGTNITYAIVTSPKNGTVTGGTTASRTYTPKANYNGKDSFAFTTNIGCMASAPAWVIINVTPVNDAPVLASIGNKSVVMGTTLTFTATASDVDAGQTKQFSLINAPAGATISASTGNFTWTPSTVGSYTFKVRVTDNGSPVLYDEEQITVTVTTAVLNASTNSLRVKETPAIILEKSSLYPNPVTDRFTVNIKTPGNCTIQIVDIKGTPVYSRKYTRDNNAVQIDASRWAAGQYLLQIIMEDGKTETLKFIKM